MEDTNTLIEQRKAKLASLRAKGIDPFLNKFTPAESCEAARAAYYDKLMDYKAATAAGSGETAARELLADAKLKYNGARRAVGLEALP